VTGLDIDEGVVEAAKHLAQRANLNIEFAVGDAEQTGLPFGAIDVITSTAGVMFASRPEAVAGELARLCRPGGRIGLTRWLPGGTIDGLFQVMSTFMLPPSPAPLSPFAWGRPERVAQLLGGDFHLRFEPGTMVLRIPTGEHVWKVFSEGYGPTKMLHRNTDRKDDLRPDFIAFHHAHQTEHGIAMPRDYLVVIGTGR
jgi:SAM-dependent methyltransferase